MQIIRRSHCSKKSEHSDDQSPKFDRQLDLSVGKNEAWEILNLYVIGRDHLSPSIHEVLNATPLLSEKPGISALRYMQAARCPVDTWLSVGIRRALVQSCYRYLRVSSFAFFLILLARFAIHSRDNILVQRKALASRIHTRIVKTFCERFSHTENRRVLFAYYFVICFTYSTHVLLPRRNTSIFTMHAVVLEFHGLIKHIA